MIIYAIIVTYNPDLERLGALLAAVVGQVERVVLIDNGSGGDLREWVAAWLDGRGEHGVDGKTINLDKSNIQTTTFQARFLPENIGLAAAQNIGIGMAQERGADYVLLLDQDSVPADDMVARLLEAATELQQQGTRLGVVGPKFIADHKTADPSKDDEAEYVHDAPPHFICLAGCTFKRAPCSPNETRPVPVDFLLASGSLVPMQVFRDVGMMNEGLFIDHIDTEFCLRLKSAGYVSYGIPAAVMRHNIGDSARRSFGRTVPIHSPLRHYYIIRNGVWIVCQHWMRPSWRVALAVNTLRRFVYYSIFTPPRLYRTFMMLKGLWHGLRGKLGKHQ